MTTRRYEPTTPAALVDTLALPEFRDAAARWRDTQDPAHAYAAYVVARRVPDRTKWTPVAVFGQYLTLWREHYRVPRTNDLPDVYREVRALVAARHARTASLAVDALFGKELEWVTGKTLDFLLSDRNWDRFVVPAMKHAAPVGEQSEYGATERKSGYRRV
jgi:hypothetical protein